jgi:hypothetical protein
MFDRSFVLLFASLEVLGRFSICNIVCSLSLVVTYLKRRGGRVMAVMVAMPPNPAAVLHRSGSVLGFKIQLNLGSYYPAF